jgi:hypothetical protein
VVARAIVSAGSADEGLFLFFAGSPTGEIALQGDPADACTANDGTYGAVTPVFPFIAYNNNSELVFVANIDCPASEPDSQGVFIASLDNDVGGGDGVLDYLDNCPTVLNTDQKNTDKALAPVYSFVVGDELGNACDPDIDGDTLLNIGEDPCTVNPDCDGDLYSDFEETFMGTDPISACPATQAPHDEDPDAWPPDFNDDTAVNVLDINVMKPAFFSSFPGPPYDVRLDLKSDGNINVLDINRMKPLFFSTCTL